MSDDQVYKLCTIYMNVQENYSPPFSFLLSFINLFEFSVNFLYIFFVCFRTKKDKKIDKKDKNTKIDKLNSESTVNMLEIVNSEYDRDNELANWVVEET